MKTKHALLAAAIPPVVYLTGCQSDLKTENHNSALNDLDIPALTVLKDTLDPLRAHFNALREQRQFLAILSPT